MWKINEWNTRNYMHFPKKEFSLKIYKISVVKNMDINYLLYKIHKMNDNSFNF